MTGIRFKCITIRDYYLIKILYKLLRVVSEPIVLHYYEALLTEYYDGLGISRPRLKKKVIDKTVEGFYFNYGYTEGLYQYWLKYYYPTCLNFVSFLALYSGEELPYTVFENTTKTALNKLVKFIEEQSVDMVRNEMSILSEIVKEYNKTRDAKEPELKVYFIWRITQDKKTCIKCSSLEGKKFKWAPDLVHPNCRCRLEVVIEEK